MGSWSAEHLQTIGLAAEVDDPRARHDEGGEPQAGEHIDRYVVLRTLGRGGMGVVCLAHDPKLDRNVAIKLHRDDREPRADAHARLRREARQLARLTHPNVVPVFDVGVARGRTFVAMQYVEGSTLAAWLRARERSHAEILRVFVEAARGLAAAHALGIIHRDFKPDNVLVGDDGHARVVDFGLARALEPDSGSARGRDDDARARVVSAAAVATPLHEHAVDSEELTRVGIVLGTPAYMAPEQHRGLPLTPAADQYAFCVALYEALAGRRPFEAASPGALLRLKQRERLAAPLGQRVPSWLLAVLQRGLRADPNARHRDMEALVTACQRHRGRRGWQALVAATGTVAAIAWAWPRAPASCDAEARIAARWSASDAAAITRAFEATGVVHAGTTAARTTAALDRRAQQWRAAGLALCHAAPEPAVLEARTRCLDDRLATFEELVDVFRHADAEVVDRAVLAIDGLPEVGDCTTLAPTTDATPSSAADREATAALHRALLRAQTLENAGRYADAVEVAAAARRDAAALGDASLRAHAEYAYGSALEQVSDLDGAREHLHAALTEANAMGDDALAAEAAMELVWLDGLDAADLDAARTWQRFAEDALHRRPDLAREARLANALGAMYSAAGAAPQASEQFERALDAFERLADAGATEGPWPDAEGSPDVATAAMNLGITQAELGQLTTARALLERAHRMYRAIEGPEHPDIANVLDAMGGVALRLGDLDTARREFTEAFELRRRSYPAGHVILARSHNSIGSLLEAEGDDDGAIAAYQRAVEGLSANLGEHALVGAALVNVGSAQCRAGHFDDAIATDERGLQLLRASLPDDHAWIAQAELGLARAHLGRGDLEAAALHRDAAARGCAAANADVGVCAVADAIAAAMAHRRGRTDAAQLVARARARLGALGSVAARDRQAFERWLTETPASATSSP